MESRDSMLISYSYSDLAYAELATYYEGGCTRVMHGVYGRTCIQAAAQVLTRQRTAAIAREKQQHTSKRTGAC